MESRNSQTRGKKPSRISNYCMEIWHRIIECWVWQRICFSEKKKKCYVGKQEPENIRNITTRKIKRLVLILLLTSSMEDAAVHFLTACCMAGGKSFNSAFCFKAGYSCSCHSFQHYCEEVVNSGQWMWKSMGAFALDCFQKGEPQKGIRSHATGSKAVTWFVAHCAIPPLGAMFPFHC